MVILSLLLQYRAWVGKLMNLSDEGNLQRFVSYCRL